MPYQFWGRDDLLVHCKRQLEYFDQEDLYYKVKNAIYDDRWNPIEEYNGCSMVQDKFHPYIPCLLHDYQWITGDGGWDSDMFFYQNLLKFGTRKGRAKKMFVGVRIGWLFYYKWKYLLNGSKGK